MNSKIRFLACCGIFFMAVITSCTSGQKVKIEQQYIHQAFDSIRHYSMHSAFNLDSLEQDLIQRITDSTFHEIVILELEKAIKSIDPHNYIITSEKFRNMAAGKDAKTMANPFPFRCKMLEDKYAYIAMYGFSGVDSTSSKNYADSLQKSITWLYQNRPQGWNLDLRQHSGGWVYPMLAGLGPILGSGVKAYELRGPEVLAEYFYFKDSANYMQLSDSIWFFERVLPVAVLIGDETGSAAELMALAFRGNPETALLGAPTAGFSTGLHGFFMPDSLQICVTHCIMTDRYKQGNGGKIEPDFIIKDPLRLFEQAYEWIDRYQ